MFPPFSDIQEVWRRRTLSKDTEQAKFNQIIDSSLLNPLRPTSRGRLWCSLPLTRAVNPHIYERAAPTPCWRGRKLMWRPPLACSASYIKTSKPELGCWLRALDAFWRHAKGGGGKTGRYAEIQTIIMLTCSFLYPLSSSQLDCISERCWVMFWSLWYRSGWSHLF